MNRASLDTLGFPITGITFVSQILFRTDIDSTIRTCEGTHSTADALLLGDTNHSILVTFADGSCRACLLAMGLPALKAGHYIVIGISGLVDDFDRRFGWTIVFTTGTRLFTFETVRRAGILFPL
jgi:hypothetical protein